MLFDEIMENPNGLASACVVAITGGLQTRTHRQQIFYGDGAPETVLLTGQLLRKELVEGLIEPGQETPAVGVKAGVAANANAARQR